MKQRRRNGVIALVAAGRSSMEIERTLGFLKKIVYNVLNKMFVFQ